MNKLLKQGLIVVAVFLCIWGILSQLDWLEITKAKQGADQLEKKVGNLYWKLFNAENKAIAAEDILSKTDSLFQKICIENGINHKEIKLHILEGSEVNAFALPDDYLIVYSGLILEAENEEELCGVMAHELAHIQLNHVMKKLVKELGISMLVTMTTGGGNTDMIKETARLFTSTAFDRNFEREADIKAVDYMINAGIDPEPFANFLYRLSLETPDAMKYLTWASTHPELSERAKYLIEHSKEKSDSVSFSPILSPDSWETLQESLKAY